MFLCIDPLKQGLNITLTDNTDSTDKRLFVLNWGLEIEARRLRRLRRYKSTFFEQLKRIKEIALTDYTDSTDKRLFVLRWGFKGALTDNTDNTDKRLFILNWELK